MENFPDGNSHGKFDDCDSSWDFFQRDFFGKLLDTPEMIWVSLDLTSLERK